MEIKRLESDPSWGVFAVGFCVYALFTGCLFWFATSWDPWDMVPEGSVWQETSFWAPWKMELYVAIAILLCLLLGSVPVNYYKQEEEKVTFYHPRRKLVTQGVFFGAACFLFSLGFVNSPKGAFFSGWPSDFWGWLFLAMEGFFALVFLVGVFASAWSWYCDRNDWLSISPNDISWSDDETGTRTFRLTDISSFRYTHEYLSEEEREEGKEPSVDGFEFDFGDEGIKLRFAELNLEACSPAIQSRLESFKHLEQAKL